MFESIILIGPGENLFPLLNQHMQFTTLPILNKPLLEYNIELLLPVSVKIFIVILEENIKSIEKIISKYNNKIEVVGISCYNGIVESIKEVSKLIKSENIIITKGNLITNINLCDVIQKYTSAEAYFLTILGQSDDDNLTIGFQDDRLVLYSPEFPEEFPDKFFENGPVTLSKELDTVQFYIINKITLSMFEDNVFRFKHNLLPKIVEQLREVRPVVLYTQKDAYVYQIKDKDTYFKANLQLKTLLSDKKAALFGKTKAKEAKQYIKKNALEDIGNVTGESKIGMDCVVINSVIGKDVDIGDGSKVFSCVIMDNVQIGAACTLDNCIIGSFVVVQPGSVLVDCVVSPGFVFDEKVNVEKELFSATK